MRKLNKIIKQHTLNKMKRKKKNIDVSEYILELIDYSNKKEKINEVRLFKKVLSLVFLERYFEADMLNITFSETLYNYFDFDLYEINDEKISKVYAYFSNNNFKEKMKSVSNANLSIKKILIDYNNVI